MEVVTAAVESVSEEKARNAAAQGWNSIEFARPVLPAISDRVAQPGHMINVSFLNPGADDEDGEEDG